MGRYKRYLFTDAKIPRTTAWRRRRAAQRSADAAVTVRTVTSVTASVSRQEPHLTVPQVDHNSHDHEGANVMGQNGQSNCSECQIPSPYEFTHGQRLQEGRVSSEEDFNEQDIATMLCNPDEITQGSDVQEDSTTPMDGSATAQQTKTQHSSELKERVCPCTSTTVGDVMLMCLALGMRHNLSWVAQVDILKMVNSIYGSRKVPDTKYYILKHMEKGKEDKVIHMCCPSCSAYLGKKEDLSETVNCGNCCNDVEISKTSTFFLSIGLQGQIRDLLRNQELVNLLFTYRFNRKKLRENALEDIYDGAEYQKLYKDGGILSVPHNFSYSFNTDGIPMGKSSNKTIWPIYVTLNELPPKERSKYILLAGLYVGNKDPDQNIFLQPFVTEANQLSTQGLTWSHDGKEINSKIIPTCSVVDSVARWQMLNMSTFHSRHGCTFCYQKSVRVQNVAQKYPIDTSKPIKLRTHESTVADMNEAFSKRHLSVKERVVHGVKGPSPLMNLMYFNLIAGMVPDYMHALLLGVIRLYMELILDPQRKKMWINMPDHIGMDHLIGAIDERLKCIQPPRSITRLPRGLTDMKIWKASEWRSWLIFYCVPCLEGLLKKKHLLHISMLSKATYILLQNSISHEELAEAKKHLLSFMCMMQYNFTESGMVYNVHLLSHLAKGVKDWGPLWTHNAFLYEGQNRYLLQLHQSPFQVAGQIARKFLTYNALPALCEELGSSESALEFCEDVMGRQLKHIVRADESVLIGKGSMSTLTVEEESCFTLSGLDRMNCQFFDKIIHKNVRYSTQQYSVGKRNKDSCIVIDGGKVMDIKKIVKPYGEKVLILVQEVIIARQPILQDEHITLQHIQRVTGHGQLMFIAPSDIAAQCVYISVPNNGNFVCRMPFGCYGD